MAWQGLNVSPWRYHLNCLLSSKEMGKWAKAGDGTSQCLFCLSSLSRSLNLSISIYPSFLLLYLSFQCLGLFVCCDSPTLAVQFILSEWIGELLIQTWPPAPLRGWIIFLSKTRSCAHYVSGSFHRWPGGRKKMRVAPGSESARADGSCGAVRWSAPLDLYALCGSLPRHCLPSALGRRCQGFNQGPALAL